MLPRYTSYPPANFFQPFAGEEFLKEIDYSNEVREKNLSFYFHMPFCRRLCHYCGCNSYPMVKEERVEAYVQALHKEIDIVAKHLDKSRRISQIHYGGGTALADTIPAVREYAETLEGDERTGARIIVRALEEPVRQIAENAGFEGSVVIAAVMAEKVGVGFNAATEKYVDMIADGIVDPAKVTRSALQNAASASAMLLTTEAGIVDIKEDNDPAAMAPGMGGMGMM